MSDVFQSIKQGLIEAIEFAQGQTSEAIVHEFAPLDIKAVRAKDGMTQAEFAATLIAMHNPPRPGEIIRDEIQVKFSAARAQGAGSQKKRKRLWPNSCLE